MCNLSRLGGLLLSLALCTLGWSEPVTFQALAIQNDVPDIYFMSGSTRKVFTVPAYALSETLTCSGGASLKFYAKKPVVAAASQDPAKEEPLAVAELPANASRVLILFSKTPQGYKCMVIPDGLDDFPVGSIRFFNGSSRSLAVNYGKTPPFQLASNETRLITGQTGNRLIQVAVQIHDGWRLLQSGFLNGINDGRRNVFLVSGGQITVSDSKGAPPRDLEMLVVDSIIPPQKPSGPSP